MSAGGLSLFLLVEFDEVGLFSILVDLFLFYVFDFVGVFYELLIDRLRSFWSLLI